MKGIQVEEMITFIGTPTVEKGVIHGLGKGVIMAAGCGVGVGRFSSSGSVKWRGSVFFRTSSGGKLAFLNNIVGVFESEIDADGNFSEKTWEWK
jgi:hypothetical protein